MKRSHRFRLADYLLMALLLVLTADGGDRMLMMALVYIMT